MQITFNGKPHILKRQISLLEFSEIMNLEPTQVAIECNHEIIPRSLYNDVLLNEGDELEIVTFIGGG